ncbi:MAG: hypothetical protein JXA90_11395 [Planctomycetes bacterium]|nr:hypothetical protein [Planctomycetota bacterium]
MSSPSLPPPPGDAPRERLPRLIAETTAQVKTDLLSRKGIDSVQILSESKFLHIVKKLVERSIQNRLRDGARSIAADLADTWGAEGAADFEDDVFVLDEDLNLTEAPLRAACENETRPVSPAAAGGLRDEYQRKWDELRSRQLKALDSIELRLERLSHAFQSVEQNLSRLDAPAEQIETIDISCGGESAASSDAAHRARRKELLEETLRKKP